MANQNPGVGATAYALVGGPGADPNAQPNGAPRAAQENEAAYWGRLQADDALASMSVNGPFDLKLLWVDVESSHGPPNGTNGIFYHGWSETVGPCGGLKNSDGTPFSQNPYTQDLNRQVVVGYKAGILNDAQGYLGTSITPGFYSSPGFYDATLEELEP